MLDYYIDFFFSFKYFILNFYYFFINNKCNIGSEIIFYRGYFFSLNFIVIIKL